MLGEMFPGRKSRHDGGEAGDGRQHPPRFDIDLDSGVVRLPNFHPAKSTGDSAGDTAAENAEEPERAPGA